MIDFIKKKKSRVKKIFKANVRLLNNTFVLQFFLTIDVHSLSITAEGYSHLNVTNMFLYY